MQTGPVKKRITELDALRGFALLGIALANFPEFSLWTFLDSAARAALPHSWADTAVRFFQYFLVDGKFYTIFSVLFGIGFSIIISNVRGRGGNGFRVFLRRMAILAAIGLIHLLFVWNGDILLLYAVVGMFLPLFDRCRPRTLLRWSAFFLTLPVIVSVGRMATGFDPSSLLYEAWWRKAAEVGVTRENFATWLRDADSYSGMYGFLRQGAVERMWEFVSGMRYFKVMGLFLIGMWLGKMKVYQRLAELRPSIRRTGIITLSAGLPLSVAYAVLSMGEVSPVIHETVYALSVYPLAISYMCGLILLFSGRDGNSVQGKISSALAYPGKMALSSYLFQSVTGITLFYGIGFGLGAGVTLWQTELIALGVFLLEIFLCGLWLRKFNYGPVEWLWRMLTYGRYLPIIKN